MENFLINYLLKNCETLAKEFFSSEPAEVVPQEGSNALIFPNILDVKMGSAIMTTPKAEIVDGTVSKEKEDELPGENIPKEDGRKESSVLFFDTQSIVKLLQIYFKTQDLQDNTLRNDTQSVEMENFLQSVFSLLQEGESIQFAKEKPIGTICLVEGSEEQGKTVEMDQYPVFESGKAMDNRALIGYLASLLQGFNASEKTDEKVENAQIETNDIKVNKYSKPQSNEAFQMFRKTSENKEDINTADEMAKPLSNKTEMLIGFENENKETLTFTDATAKLYPKIEVKKLNDRENVFQIISNESLSGESDEINKNISVLTMKTEKPSFLRDNNLPEFISIQPLSGENENMNKNISALTVKTEKGTLARGEDVVGAVSKTSDKAANDYTGPDERQLLSQNDYTKTSTHIDKDAGKVLEKTPFASLMTDRIEKIVEQYANKSASMDMVVRLKIDEKETLLVALKDQGQRVIVEVKTTNEGMGTFLQSQKEEIARQLEGKHIYANIYVDVQNENREKRDQRDNQKKRSDEQENEDFVGYLETMV
jgi:hypothetical protein